jgi:hypothetical protein
MSQPWPIACIVQLKHWEFLAPWCEVFLSFLSIESSIPFSSQSLLTAAVSGSLTLAKNHSSRYFQLLKTKPAINWQVFFVRPHAVSQSCLWRFLLSIFVCVTFCVTSENASAPYHHHIIYIPSLPLHNTLPYHPITSHCHPFSQQ